MKNILIILLYSLLFGGITNAQVISIDECVKLALENNKLISLKTLDLKRAELESKSKLNIPKTDLNYMLGQYNSIHKNDNQWNISQTIPFPSSFYHQNKVSQYIVKELGTQNDIFKEDLILDLKLTYQDLILAKKRILLLQRNDSIFKMLDDKMKLKLKYSEIAPNDYTLFVNQKSKNSDKLNASLNDFYQIQIRLKQIIGTENFIEPELSDVQDLINDNNNSINDNKRIQFYDLKSKEKDALKKYNIHEALPDLTFSYINQTLIGTQEVNGSNVYFGSDKRFQAFNFGVSIPFFYMNTSRKNKALTFEQNQIELEKKYVNNQLELKNIMLVSTLKSLNERLLNYQAEIIPKNNLIKEKTFISYQNGEISQIEWLYSVQISIETEWEYLSLLNEKNKTIINLQWINGKIF